MEGFSSRAGPTSSWLEQLASTARDSALSELPQGVELCAGRYLVRREVGRGGMGIVYEAWDAERQESVALKTLSRSSPTSIYRIKQEFRGLAHLTHPNLVRLHELFEDAGRWCFTLELVPGETLLRALHGAPAAPVLAALRQLCDGICALHAAGKLHRDLKPNNVLCTPSGRVVILDFGLAEDISALAGPSEATGHSGTPGYMAPELLTGGRASPASDWYSFGVIVWELLTGRLPWEAERAPVPNRSAAPPGLDHIPIELVPFCRSLLALDPALRPGAAEVRAVLEPKLLQGARATAAPRAPSSAPGAGSAPPRGFLGRARELDWLRQAYAACCRGQRPVVLLLSGESGIGKSALVQSFLSEHEQALVLLGRCYEREFVPYKAFDAAVDELCRYLLQLPEPELEALLPDDFTALCLLFPVLGRVREVGTPAQQSEDAHELRRRGFVALEQLLGRLRERMPVLLWIDDLQWTDGDSTSLLLHLLRQPSAPKILLIASHRSDLGAQHRGLRELYETLASDVRLDVRALELGPLAREDALSLLESVAPRAPRELLEQAAAQAQGHPFLLEQLSRYAERSAPDPDAWPSLEEAIAARLEVLPLEQRKALELLAFAGRPLLEPVGRAAAGAGWHSAVQALCSTRLARRSPVDGSASCYHDSIREAVLGTASARRARQCHRSLARAMLRCVALQPEHLALHLVGSGHPARGAEQMAVAAGRAAAALAFERAAQLYQGALEQGRFAASDARRLQVARAHALAAAGHGFDAAQLYLAVAQAGSFEPSERSAEVLELRTRAAEQYLLSGRLEQGLELLRGALRSLGLRLPSSAPGTIASFAYQRTRLRLRGYHFEAQLVPEPVARRLQLLQRASAALARLDPLRASELASRALLLALESGSAEAISGALVSDLVMGTLLRVSDAELGQRRERAEHACARHGSPQERAQLHSALATVARLKAQPDLPAALEQFERFFEIHRAHVLPRASYERPWEEWARSVVRCLQGQLATVAREVPARLDEGWARGDHCIVPLWAGGDQLLARLAVGDVEAAERDWARAERAWSSRSFTLQDLMLALGATHLQRYRGNPRGAWQIAETARQRLESSPLRRMPNAVDAIQSMRGHAALELAARAESAQERRQWLELARGIQRPPPPQLHLPTLFRCHLLDAARHFQQGDEERAALLLGRAEPHLESIPLYAQAVRYRRGLLMGGARGEELVVQARGFFCHAGVVEPERFLELLVPGYTPRQAARSARAPSAVA